VGADPGFLPAGYLLLARTREGLAALGDVVTFAARAGVDGVHLVDRAGVRALNAAVDTDGVAGGAFSARDGFIRPLAILRGYLAAAERLGVEVRLGAGDVAPEVSNGRVVGVVRLEPDGASTRLAGATRVVVACGAWSGALAQRCGLEVPVVPERRQVAITEPFDELPAAMPMTIDLEDGFHLRVRDGRVLLLWPSPTRGVNPADPFDTSFDAGWLDGVVARAHARIPCLERARIDRAASWTGLYEMTPDGHLLLGEHPGARGLYLATGGSGHGVMHSPAVGQVLAEMITGATEPAIDVHALRPSRFAEGEPIEGNALL
jgi:sarcosine oxidase subunit beta